MQIKYAHFLDPNLNKPAVKKKKKTLQGKGDFNMNLVDEMEDFY